MFPIITSISDVQESTPKSDESRRRIGAFLRITANNVNAITSSMFITAMAAGPVVAQLASDSDAQVVAIYTLFLSVAVAAGAPPLATALLLGCTSGLISAMTHYASGPSALIYGAGYVKTAEFLRVGLIRGVVTVAIYLTIGLDGGRSSACGDTGDAPPTLKGKRASHVLTACDARPYACRKERSCDSVR